MIEIAAGQLPRRPALGGNDEDVIVTGFEIPHAVETVGHRFYNFRSRCPVRPFRRRRRLRQGLVVVGHEHHESEVASVGRPAHCPGRLPNVADDRGLARIHPANVQLCAPSGYASDEGQAIAPGRPARTGVIAGSRQQRTVIPAVRIQLPDVRYRAVRHDVHRGPYVNDARSVRRYLRIGGVLEFEDVHVLQDRGLGPDGNRCDHQHRKNEQPHGIPAKPRDSRRYHTAPIILQCNNRALQKRTDWGMLCAR